MATSTAADSISLKLKLILRYSPDKLESKPIAQVSTSQSATSWSPSNSYFLWYSYQPATLEITLAKLLC